VWAEREAAPKHKYRFEVSADWKSIGKLWISPVDVADGYSVKDAERLATGGLDHVPPLPNAVSGNGLG
jgi:hypothetical protein